MLQAYYDIVLPHHMALLPNPTLLSQYLQSNIVYSARVDETPRLVDKKITRGKWATF